MVFQNAGLDNVGYSNALALDVHSGNHANTYQIPRPAGEEAYEEYSLMSSEYSEPPSYSEITEMDKKSLAGYANLSSIRTGVPHSAKLPVVSETDEPLYEEIAKVRGQEAEVKVHEEGPHSHQTEAEGHEEESRGPCGGSESHAMGSGGHVTEDSAEQQLTASWAANPLYGSTTK